MSLVKHKKPYILKKIVYYILSGNPDVPTWETKLVFGQH